MNIDKSLLKYCLFLFLIIQFNVVFSQKNYNKTGMASYYADKFEGRKTASGEIYKHSKLTAAHRTLPFGTKLKITNLKNGKSVIVRVNDRGPFVKGRIVDLSKRAAMQIDLIKAGVAKVRVEQVGVKTKGTTNNKVRVKRSSSDVKSENSTCYKIAVSSKSIYGYGVQVGSFSLIENLIKTTNTVGELISGDFFVMVSKINGKTVNRLIVGVGNDKSKVIRHMKRLKSSFPDCFVVKL